MTIMVNTSDPETAAANLEPLPRGRVGQWVATLDPGYFAAVMATGIVSLGLRLLGHLVLADIMLWVTGAAFVMLVLAYALRAARYPHRVVADLRAPSSAVAYFTVVAGFDVLAVGLVGVGLWPVALALGLVAFAVWLMLTYGLFSSIVLAGNRPPLRAITGVWLVWVVGTQSIAVVAASLAPRVPWSWAPGVLSGTAILFWGVGVVLYFIFVVIIFLRLFLIETTPKEMGPAYWILMGATAISVRAAAGILDVGQSDPTQLLREMRPFVVGLSMTMWSFGSWFIPLLVIFGLWRYFVRGYSWGYEPKLWSVVFPLGMYAVASVTLGRAIGFGFLVDLATVWIWFAVAAWALVTALLVAAFVVGLRRPAHPSV
jgi:tellurite resistance protein TehA-like permease